jgi:hypothetical protein
MSGLIKQPLFSAVELSCDDYPQDDDNEDHDPDHRDELINAGPRLPILGNLSQFGRTFVFCFRTHLAHSLYPNLTSSIFNKPEPDFNNEKGLCCGRPIKWQMFIPTFGLFMTETNYRCGWSFEDDIIIFGCQSLCELIRSWDLELDDHCRSGRTA